MNLSKTIALLDGENRKLMMGLLSAIVLMLTFMACAPLPKEEPAPVLARKEIFPLTDDGDKESLQTAINKSLSFLEKKLSAADPFPNLPGPFEGLFTPERTYRTLRVFKEICSQSAGQADFESRVAEKFLFLDRPDQDKQPSLLVTGYYEPIFEGNLEGRGEYRYPIYCIPADLVEIRSGGLSKENEKKKIGRIEKGEFIPYYSRAEIDTQEVLKGKGFEIAWLKDPWERFVLHIQGSGQIRLPDGKIIRVGFANSNGRPYRGIGQYLVEQGYFPETDLSLRRVWEFLRENPEKREDVLNQNERYIFFRIMPEGNGPYGSLGFPLTAGRSIALDHAVFPQGALGYIITQKPVLNGEGKLAGKAALRRFVLNQDTGAAMKGSGRIDFFCGTGEKAGLTAGEMREGGKIFFLLAKE